MNLDQLTDLSPEQQQLLLLLLAEQQEEIAPDLVSIQPVSRQGNLPLSFSQHRLWFLDQLLPASAMYNMPAAARLKGRLDAKAMERTLAEIVRRHEVLRTAFPSVDGQPQPIITPAVPVLLRIIDLSGSSDQEAEAALFISKEVQTPFDLACGPLIRTCLLRLADDEHILIVTLHHIVSDGWSIGVFIQELAKLYTAYQSGQTSPLLELAIQYADFAAWQNQQFKAGLLESQLVYWQQQLADAPALLELPTDHPRPPVQSYKGAAHTLNISPALTKRLEQLAQQEGTTLFMVLLAAFKLLLARYCRQSDIVVGTPIANRNRVEIEPLIGFFVNTLVLRTDLSGGLSFRELLARVRQVTLEAYDHQDLPFEKLVEVLQPDRNLAYHPLFQVLFVLQNVPLSTIALPGLQLKPVEMPDTTAKFDLTLELIESPSGVIMTWEYRTDLFEAKSIECLAGHFLTLLHGLIANPDQSIHALPLLNNTERQQLLVDWNATHRDFPDDRCLHELIVQQVECHPDAIALIVGDQQLSYQELNRRANQVAHHLQSLGVGPELLVGICLERSLELVICLLAVLKAGGAYVPLDPSYPSERLAFIAEDSGLSVLVGGGSFAESLQRRGVRVVDPAAVVRADDTNPICQASAENLFYILYTSGSTGTPKGVPIQQRSLLNFLWAMDEKLALQPTDAWLAVSAITFDIAALEIWLPLIRGATVILADEESRLDGRRLVDLITDAAPAFMQATPATWRILLEAGWQAPPSLTLLCGGEALTPHLAEQLRRSGARLWNLYGPTETTVWSTIYQVETVKTNVPIGRPLANTQVFVLDDQQQLVPIGVPGELYIGGSGLTPGYLNRPELTAVQFLSDPFSTEIGKRLYRTGDLVRWRQAGVLEFLGRLDQQVKLRGFRIELGEIESVLNGHPDVQQAVVVLRGELEAQFLVAYTVVHLGSKTDSAGLRHYLKDYLPAYMMPASFFFLEALPLTPNGKVDRKALPMPTKVQAALPSPPANGIEARLLQIWKAILPVEQIGIEDNFFALGGHSLMANRAIYRVREAFEIVLPVRALFEAPTIRELALKVHQALASTPAATVQPPILPVSRTVPLAPSFAQEGLWYLHQLSSQASLYNLPAATRLRGMLVVPVLEQALAEVMRRHEVLRSILPTDASGQPSLVIVPASPFKLPIIDLSSLPEREAQARLLAEAEIHKPFDLAVGPLMRSCLLRLADHEHILIVTLHHIVSDAWSIGVFIQELSALYAAYQSGQASPLAELSIHYADFAAWQRQTLPGASLENALAYWQHQLTGAPPRLELPTDRPRPPIQHFNGATHRFDLPAELTRHLQQLAQREGATLFMVLLAAFKLLLARYSRQNDIVVGVPVANRNRTEIEPLIGYFVNALVLRSDLEGAPSFRELLARVRQVTLAAFEHQDLPFEKLVEVLRPQRELSYAPLFQVMFVLQNAAVAIKKMANLEVEPYEVFDRVAKFDLTLNMEQTEEGIRAALEYNTDLFEAETIDRLSSQLHRLLAGIVLDPDRPISSFPLLSDVERQELVHRWNDTKRAYPLQQCLHQLVVQQVERSPQAIALVFEDQQLSYQQLNRRANQLAHHLQSLGVGPEVLVGVCLERSLELVICLLAILKAGGAYVPLDPSYPAERLDYMLQDAQIAVIVTHNPTESHFCGYAQVLHLEAAAEAIGQLPTTNPVSAVVPENLAYLIYTSGSTGRPKGVMNIHQGICNRLLWMQEQYQLTCEHVVLQKTPFSFDVSVWEFFWPLLAGGKLVVAKPEAHRDPESLLKLIEAQQVTHIHFVPSMLSVLLEAPDLMRRLRSLRQVFCSGEALPYALKERFFRSVEAVELHNLYGPTEAAVDVTFWQCQPDTQLQSVPIGHPIANTEIHIFDEQLEPVPIGVVGELFIGGIGLARGYLNQAQLTAQKFIIDEGSRGRLYRTGDLARRRSDGAIEYVGRLDFQVKLRGLRLELGEIETVLGSHPAVRDAVVVVRGEAESEVLVAYVVFDGDMGGALEYGALEGYLKERLPEYMVPVTFVALDALPLNPNGKLDRKALPDPIRTVQVGIAPRTPLEQVIADIWAEVLNLENVGVEDNFFHLGGHSLLATQVISQIKHTFGLDVPLYALFEAPTVAGLAATMLKDPQHCHMLVKTAQLLLTLADLSDDDAEEMLLQKTALSQGNTQP